MDALVDWARETVDAEVDAQCAQAGLKQVPRECGVEAQWAIEPAVAATHHPDHGCALGRRCEGAGDRPARGRDFEELSVVERGLGHIVARLAPAAPSGAPGDAWSAHACLDSG